jgi:hypothetical protein
VLYPLLVIGVLTTSIFNPSFVLSYIINESFSPNPLKKATEGNISLFPLPLPDSLSLAFPVKGEIVTL